MPNLTSYRASTVRLNREIPKTPCDLIQHELNYTNFLRSRIANIQSSLASTNKKHSMNNISHFRLRQKQWKEKIENENKRFIQSLIYRREKYQPIHDRYVAQKSYEQHLKLLQTMSQYSKYDLTNSVCKNLLKDIRINQFNKCRAIKTNQYSHRSTPYIENIVQQTINKAIQIYNQSLPSPPNRIRTSHSEIHQRLKPSLHRQETLFRSIYAISPRSLNETKH